MDACTRSVLVRDGEFWLLCGSRRRHGGHGTGAHQKRRGRTSKRPRNSDKVAPYEGRVGRRMASQARKKARRVPHSAGRVFAARGPSRLGRSGVRPLTNFTFWGRLPPKYAGRATRTERELDVD